MGYSGRFFTDQLPRGAGGGRVARVRAWPPNALAAALGAQLHRGIGSRRSVNLALRFSWTLCLLILPPRPRPPALITLCRCLTRRSSLGCTLIPFSDIDVDARSPDQLHNIAPAHLNHGRGPRPGLGPGPVSYRFRPRT